MENKIIMKKWILKTVLFCLFCSITACGQNKSNKESDYSVPTKETIGIIGAGNVGSTLGEKWAKAGYKVLFSSLNLEESKKLAKKTGHQSEGVSVEDAAKRGNIIVLAVPFKAEASLSKQIGPLIKDKILLECDNAYPGRDGDIANDAKAIGVANYSFQHYFPNVKMIRAFSSSAIVNVKNANKNNPITVPYALSNNTIKNIAEELIIATDGIPRYIGSIKDSKSLDY